MRKQGVEMLTLKQMSNFKFHPQNRSLTSNVAAIKKSIELSGLDTIPAIIVSSHTMNILDGQNRWQAMMDLMEEGKIRPWIKFPVQWRTDCDTLAKEFDAIVSLNAKPKQWKMGDYFKAHVQSNLNYQRLHDFCIEFGITDPKTNLPSYRAGLAVIFGQTQRGNYIKSGELIVTEDDIECGRKNWNEIEQLLRYITAPDKKSSYGFAPSIKKEEFAKAWLEWHKGVGSHIEFSAIIKELRTHKATYNKMPKTSKGYFIDIFNRINANICKRENNHIEAAVV